VLKRLAAFLRSVLPADPTQLIFLAGIVCLFLAPHLRWWPQGLSSATDRLNDSSVELVHSLGFFFLLPISFAAMAGYFVCFWPGEHPVRRILILICLPAVGGMGLMFGRLLYVAAPSSSVLEGVGSVVAHKLSWAQSLPWSLLTGFHFCVIGLFLIAIYTSRLAFGIAVLPLSLPGDAASACPDHGAWKRVQFLICVLVGPLYFLDILLALLTIGIPTALPSHVPNHTLSVWIVRVSPVVEVLVVIAVISWIVGEEGRKRLLRGIRLTAPRYFVLGFAIPIVIGAVISVGQFAFDRAQWAAHNFGQIDSPVFGNYITLPDPWLLLLFFSAFMEEMIFRGFLQGHFVERYGVYRGIFLVGIVWAAFHFSWDFNFVQVTDKEVILGLASRICICLALSYVFGWLMLRSGSVLPSALAHTFYNVLVFSHFGPPFIGKSIVQVILWGVLAYMLYRYWPSRDEDQPELTPRNANPELVV